MRLRIIGKADLDAKQSEFLAKRLAAPEHINDTGPRTVWHIYQASTLFAFVLADSGLPMAIAEASGPLNAVNAGWWIDRIYRSNGYGRELVDLLAASLKDRGYTGVGYIRVDTFQGRYDERSSRMLKRFKGHFE